MKATLLIFASALALNCVLAITAHAEAPAKTDIKPVVVQAQADHADAERAMKLVLAQADGN